MFDGFTIKLNLKYKTQKKAKLFTTQINLKTGQFQIKICFWLSLDGTVLLNMVKKAQPYEFKVIKENK